MRNFTLNCKGKLLVAERPLLMGILNITPDSFFEGSRFREEKNILEQIDKMLEEGADMIDIGGLSSRPQAELISEEEELRRVVPAIESIHRHFPQAILSIDTFRSRVAGEAILHGVAVLNDISGGTADERMLELAAAHACPIILMHRIGEFSTMHQSRTTEDIMEVEMQFFSERIAACKAAGVHDVILDPGFGFSKSLEQNYRLLKELRVLTLLERPVLAGLSRKSMLCRPLGIEPDNALNATTAAHMIALQNGASLLRVHDVKAAAECVAIFEQVDKA